MCEPPETILAQLRSDLLAIRNVLEVSDNTKTCTILMLAENMVATVDELRADLASMRSLIEAHEEVKARLVQERDAALAEGAVLREALGLLIGHYAALHGPRAHHLGCDCGGTNDGVHSCWSFERAWLDAALATLHAPDSEGSTPCSPTPK